MNGINRAVTKFFDVVLTPLEAISDEFALLFVSGVFGVLALWLFKHISWQKGIKGTKDKIKGHLIEIRLYQDDLVLVSKAIGKVLLRNLQYMFLNFAPFIPLMIPFALVAAQMVVRYSFDPVPVQQSTAQLVVQNGRIGEGDMTLLIDGDSASIDGMEIVFPEGLEMTGPLALVARHGNATQHFRATAPGTYDIVVKSGGQEILKQLVVGHKGDVRAMQPERVTGLFDAILWPAEDTLAGTGLESIRFVSPGGIAGYPESDLGWLPLSGPLGVLVAFVLASMIVGFIFLKPLGVQI